MYRVLGITDDVTQCQCCGKSGLKSTVAMESQSGDLVYFGSVCATRHTGWPSKAIKAAARSATEERQQAATIEYRQHPTVVAYEAAVSAENAQRTLGKARAARLRPYGIAAEEVYSDLLVKFNVKYFAR